jgi:hypothetical protein
MLSVIRLLKEAARQALTAKTVGTRRSRRGLSRLSPEAIGKAINETDKQVNGIMLAFVGAAAFCVLSLLTPDSALLGSSEKLNVPLAGPVSFVGFIIIGPTVVDPAAGLPLDLNRARQTAGTRRPGSHRPKGTQPCCRPGTLSCGSPLP